MASLVTETQESKVKQPRTTSANWEALAFFFLIGALPGIISSAVVISWLHSPEPPKEDRGTGTITNSTVSDMPTQATMLPAAPSKAPSNVCITNDCRHLEQWLKLKLNYNADPCHDFYEFVCSPNDATYGDPFRKTETDMLLKMTSAARAIRVPAKGQTAYEKSVALFQSCIALAYSNRNETSDLVSWMKSLKLDLVNATNLTDFEPVDTMLRLMNEFLLDAIISAMPVVAAGAFFVLHASTDAKWRMTRRDMKREEDLKEYYANRLVYLRVDNETMKQTIDTIEIYEKRMDGFLNNTVIDPALQTGNIETLGNYTDPQVTAEDWAVLIAKYTKKAYGLNDTVIYQAYILDVLGQLLKSEEVGKRGLHYLIAWAIFMDLVYYTVPGSKWKTGFDSVSSCQEIVMKYMTLAFPSKYLHTFIKDKAVQEAEAIFTNVHAANKAAFESSSWLTGKDRAMALRKLENMKHYVGSPMQKRGDAFLNALYESLQDIPTDRFFNTFIKVVEFIASQILSGRMNTFYNETTVNAYYVRLLNTMIIPTSTIQPPFFFGEGPAAFNYGSLGPIVGHEIMHGFDVEGMDYDENGKRKIWLSKEVKEHYTNKTLCLRTSHKAVLGPAPRQSLLNDTVDSESLADMVGARIAYEAFTSLPAATRSTSLHGLNLTSEQLFFVGFCTKLCEIVDQSERYAPARSRCIVPLMNMPEFSAAFKCQQNASMNPPSKCAFWQ